MNNTEVNVDFTKDINMSLLYEMVNKYKYILFVFKEIDGKIRIYRQLTTEEHFDKMLDMTNFKSKNHSDIIIRNIKNNSKYSKIFVFGADEKLINSKAIRDYIFYNYIINEDTLDRYTLVDNTHLIPKLSGNEKF